MEPSKNSTSAVGVSFLGERPVRSTISTKGLKERACTTLDVTRGHPKSQLPEWVLVCGSCVARIVLVR